MDVGKRITFFREKKGITVNKLANLSGISQSFLRDIELGKKHNYKRLYASIYSFNKQSQKMFESVGFSKIDEDKYEYILWSYMQTILNE